MRWISFAGAVVFLCIAHLIRLIRWSLFISIYEKPNKRVLIQALCSGYLLNYILPFKLGEVVRAYSAGGKMENGRALGFSTVIVDRYLDIVSVGLLFGLISLFGAERDYLQTTAYIYFVVAVALLIFAFMIYAGKRYVKKGIRAFASIFNEQIESALLSFAWALIWNFKDMFQKISKVKMLLSTVCMWCSYLLSYFAFSAFLRTFGEQADWVDIFAMLFTNNGIVEATIQQFWGEGSNLPCHPLLTMLYMLLPLGILLVFSFSVKTTDIVGIRNKNYLRLLPHMDVEERLSFLENYFSGQNRAYVENYLKINQGISIVRDYSAGSNATTLLCMDGKCTFFRKYAFGTDGDKLYQQVCWINDNAAVLPLPTILKSEKNQLYCYYDMPYNSNAVGMFEYAHSMPNERVWEIIQKVFESLESSIYKTDVHNADTETIHRYVQSKVVGNIDRIKSARCVRDLLQYETIVINGVPYRNLPYYEKYLSEEFLQKVFEKDLYSVIHGDLTIENIICLRGNTGEDSFYIIDPNTGNIHNSPNLDYAKLLQSIHGGYEFLMSTTDLTVTQNHINFLFTRSSVYADLHRRMKEYMISKLGETQTRSIYFHEIVHWLRLLPYKIEKNGKRALLFYAGMLIVLDDVIGMYGDR